MEEGGHETILLKTISSPYWYMIMNKNHSSPLFSFELPNHPCILYEVTWSKFQKLLNSYSVEKLPLHLGHTALRYIPLQCINHHQINWYPSRLTPTKPTNHYNNIMRREFWTALVAHCVYQYVNTTWLSLRTMGLWNHVRHQVHKECCCFFMKRCVYIKPTYNSVCAKNLKRFLGMHNVIIIMVYT